ncbi:proline-rich protein 36-like isoform X2 [Oncorhynchus masou masou]|uniref:proline-rich protein 36-like isoform X2 n=1 Tax=Oncorhynchus masou masou TaxID=90313 RepID=UPI003183CC5B
MERKEHPVGEVLIIPMRSSTSLSPQDSAQPLQPSSPPPPLSLSSPQLQAEFLRRAPSAASPDNDSARHQNLLHQPSPSVSPFSSPPTPLSSPPPPLSLSSPQLQAEFLRRAPRAASPDNDLARHKNLPHQPSPSVSPSVSLFSSPPTPLSSPPPPLSLSSPQLQAEFLRRAPSAASPDNDSARHQNLLHQPSPSVSPFSSPPTPLSSPPPPLSLSSPQLQAEFLRRAPRAASPDNDLARHKNLPHQPSPSVSPSVSLFSSPPTPLSSPPPPLSLSSPQLQAEFLRRAPRAASPDNDLARHKNLPHQPSPSVSPSVSLFSSPPTPLSSPPPPLSLSSPQLQAEFLRRASRGLRTVSCDTSDVLTSPSSTLVSPFTSITTSTLTSPPQPLSSSMPTKEGCTTLLSLSSPELLTELCQSQSRPMKHVSVSKGLTTVFSGRGRGIKNPSPATASGAANQTLRSDSMANRRGQAGSRLSNGTKH